MPEKLIRNLRKGDRIKVVDATKKPAVTHRVTITNVHEDRLSLVGRRTWRAHFEPKLFFGSWSYLTAYSTDKIEVLR